jgi:hypothetical protein
MKKRQTEQEGVRTYGQASLGIFSVPEMPDAKRSSPQAAYVQKPEEQPQKPDDEKSTEQTPPLSSQQQDALTAIENFSRHFGLEKEGLAFAHAQAGLPPPTEEQEKAAKQGLPARPEPAAEKTFPFNNGGFYLGEKAP